MSLQFNIMKSMGLAIGLLMLTNSAMPQSPFRGTYFGGSQQEGVVARLSDDLKTLLYTPYFGGAGDDGGCPVFSGATGEVYIYGFSSSINLPTSNGGTDAFVARLALDQFTRVTGEPLVTDGGWSWGSSWVDYDGDGSLDLFVSNWDFFGGPTLNYLYHNNGDGTSPRFSRVTTGPVVDDGSSVASTWADFDNDGDDDGYVCGHTTPNHFYVNEGNGQFAEMTEGPLVTGVHYASGAVWVDYDNDGWLDLFAANHRWPGDPPVECDLFRNVGGVFIRQDNTAIGLVADEGNYPAWGDIDGDGDLDLFVTRNDNTSLLYANDGDGTFTLLTGSIVSNEDTHAGSFADYDNDGDLDMYASGVWLDSIRLYQNDGVGNFVNVAPLTIGNDLGYWTGGHWGDCDNDGDLDLYVTADYLFTGRPNRLYINNGDGTFSRVTTGSVVTDSEASNSATWTDYDRDGDLDLFVANLNNQNNTLYLNNGNNNHWVEITCVGTRSNRSAIGTKVRLKADIEGRNVRQLREISSQSGSSAQNQITAHFGLGDATVIDSLIIEWPSGVKDLFDGVTPNQLLTVTEGSSDIDGDGISALTDNCPLVYNPLQEDANTDGTGDACCCVGLTGNVDCDPTDGVDISDLSALIDNLYISLAPLCCPNEANTDGQPGTDISDLSALIDYLYISFTATAACL